MEKVTEEVRLNKYLAQCGLCSRRDADGLIASGRIVVNGVVAQPGTRVTDLDEVCLDGRKLPGKRQIQENKKVVLAYYKPVGVVCTERDAHAEKTVIEAVNYPVRVTYAGRLDKDSEGLLLLTNDGDLIDFMMRGANNHEKEYVVKLNRKISKDDLDKLRQGIYLRDLDCTTRPCQVESNGPYTINITLTQGLNRQIRRMCKELHYEVRSLKRIRVMSVKLDKLKPGEYRELSEAEINKLWNS